MKTVDLRSDTVTRPTPAMRAAMAGAEVGDDVFGDDPTINRLQAMAAERLGKEAALFVASGTMGNLTSLLAHCGRGDEVIMGDLSHTFVYEQGGMAALGGIVPHTIPNQPDGTLRLSDIERAIRSDNVHFPRTRLIVLENTHNNCNGTPLTVEYTAAVCSLARRYGLRVHIDGARIFNAAVALNAPVDLLVRGADSVTFCLSKGLGAPVGSVICGSRAFIDTARRARKVLGGGMRQAGILAAAGIVALEQMAERLDEDHARAKRLAAGLALLPGLVVQPPATNILYFQLADDCPLSPEAFLNALENRGVWVMGRGGRAFRAVTHVDVDDEGIDQALAAAEAAVAGV